MRARIAINRGPVLQAARRAVRHRLVEPDAHQRHHHDQEQGRRNNALRDPHRQVHGVAALVKFVELPDDIIARNGHWGQDRDKKEGAGGVGRASIAQRREVEDGVDADMHLPPGDRHGAGIDAEDHQIVHRLFRPRQRVEEEIAKHDVQAVDADDRQQRRRGEPEAEYGRALAEALQRKLECLHASGLCQCLVWLVTRSPWAAFQTGGWNLQAQESPMCELNARW
jgi:hypothetical protein